MTNRIVIVLGIKIQLENALLSGVAALVQTLRFV